MERTIKFRGKTPQGEWVYGFYHHLTRKGGGHFIIDEDNEHVSVLPDTVVQYVGNVAVDSGELWLNDIVSFKLPDTPNYKGYTSVGVIEWDEVGARYVINEVREGELGWDYHNIHEDIKIEIIGNTTDNHDLLKVI